MDSFFVDENDIIDAINEINNRDAHNSWEYEIVDDTLLNLNWSYLGVTFSIELCDDGSLIARDDHGNIIIMFRSQLVACCDGGADALIALMPNEQDAGVLVGLFLDYLWCAIRAAVIYDINRVDEIRQAVQHRPDFVFFVICGNNDGNTFVTIHE